MTTIVKGNKHSEQNIQNWSFDDDYNVAVRGMLGSDGSNLYYLKVNAQGELVVSTGGGEQNLKLTESGNYTYVAKAPVGTAQASAAWQAFRIDETSGLVILWADANDNFDNVATDLTVLSYS